jgi:hypothetical protein
MLRPAIAAGLVAIVAACGANGSGGLGPSGLEPDGAVGGPGDGGVAPTDSSALDARSGEGGNSDGSTVGNPGEEHGVRGAVATAQVFSLTAW